MPNLLSPPPRTTEDGLVPARGGDVMRILRSRTAERHRRLEAAVDLVGSITTTEVYGDLLVKFAALHQRLDEEVVSHMPDQDGRRKMPLLSSDLAGLGRTLPAPTASFGLDTPAARIGALYVVEGSTLGGRVISAHVRETLPAGTPAAYFAGYEADTARQWNEFRSLARQTLRDDAAADAAYLAATEVFDRFIKVLS
jgi:heme oxygenase